MTTPAQLAQQLGNLTVATTNGNQPAELHEQLENLNFNGTSGGDDSVQAAETSHTLFFDFPAVDLLSDPAALYLPEPHLVDWRPRPETMQFHLATYDPMNLFAVLESPFQSLYAIEIDSENATSFLLAIEDLATQNGQTTMSVAIHTTNDEPEVRVRLSTTMEGTDNTKASFWDLSVSDFSAIMTLDRPWLEILSDVVFRKTTRSYLAAGERLKGYSPVLHQLDSQKWASRWGSGAPSTAKQLLIKYFRNLCSETILSFDDLEEDAAIHLPCGHDVFITKEKIDDLPDDECMELACPDCNTRILPTSGYEEAKMYQEFFNIYEASSKQDGWAKMDEWSTDESLKMFSRTALVHAVPAAFQSLQLPESIDSRHAAPVLFPQTSVAVQVINEWLEGHSDILDDSPLDMVNQLESVAVEKVVEADMASPPTWETFLKIALNRAVNLAISRRCSKIGDGHGGVHLHGRNIFVSVDDGSGDDDEQSLLGDLEEESGDMELDD